MIYVSQHIKIKDNWKLALCTFTLYMLKKNDAVVTFHEEIGLSFEIFCC